MNFNLHRWHRMPSHLDFATFALIGVVWFSMAPARADEFHTARIGVVQPRCSGEFRAIATNMQAHCMGVATDQHFGAASAREGDSLCIGQPLAASRLVYKTRLVERIVANEAARAARCISLPVTGSFGVMQAGAVRGSGAGIPGFLEINHRTTHAARSACNLAAMAVSAAHNQELRRA